MALLVFSPAPGPRAVAGMVWSASQALLAAAADGRRDDHFRLGLWLANTCTAPQCPPALARCIEGSLKAARRRLAEGTAPIQPGETPQ